MNNFNPQSRTEQSRIEYIDVFRALGILLMVMGHVNFGRHFDYFIHAFHMPMFFIVGGLFFKDPKKQSTKKFIIKRIKTLLIPYYCFGFFHYCLYCAVHGFNKGPLFHLLWDNSDGLPIAGALWFLTAYFISELIFFLIMKYIHSNAIKTVVIIVISLLGCIWVQFTHIVLPLKADAGLVGVGLLYAGYLGKKCRNSKILYKLIKLKPLGILLLGSFTTLLIFTNGYVNMRVGSYSFVPLFWINALLASIVGLDISRWLTKHLKKRCVQFISYCGKNSIVFLCLNQLCIVVVKKIHCINLMPVFTSRCLILAIVIILLYVVTYLFVNTPLCFVIGRKYNFKR